MRLRVDHSGEVINMNEAQRCTLEQIEGFLAKAWTISAADQIKNSRCHGGNSYRRNQTDNDDGCNKAWNAQAHEGDGRRVTLNFRMFSGGT